MRILYIVPYVPSLIRSRSYNLIYYLNQLGHEVTVVTLQSNEAESEDVARLKKECHRLIVYDLPKWRSLYNCLRVLPSSRPLQSVYCWQPEMAHGLKALLTAENGHPPFDVIHVEHLRGAQYGLYLKEMGTAVPIVWDSVDCISFLFEQAIKQTKSQFGRLITNLDLNRTRQFEGSVVNEFDRVLVTSPIDKEALLALASPDVPEPPVMVLAQGANLEAFTPDRTVKRDAATIIVTGKMSYHANITMVMHLVEAIMPLVWQERPDAKLMIVGKDPSPALQKLAEQSNIIVTGMVPELAPYLRQATLAVAPIPYAAGMQNKVLEAMACATPVVVSPQAAKSFTAVPHQHFLVGDRPTTFAAHILTLLNNPQFAQHLGENGYQFVKHHHDWRQIAGNLADIYQSLMA
jgi:glycosyltransferase involved in cell wall biosynthesis